MKLNSLRLEHLILCRMWEIAFVLFYIFKNYGKERLMLTSHESLVLNCLSGSLFCRAETSTVYDEMIAWGQPNNSHEERLFLFCVTLMHPNGNRGLKRAFLFVSLLSGKGVKKPLIIAMICGLKWAVLLWEGGNKNHHVEKWWYNMVGLALAQRFK